MKASATPVFASAPVLGAREDGGGVEAGELAAEEPLCLFGFEFSLDTGSLDDLESAVRTATAAWLSQQFERTPRTVEAVRLATCHRLELVVLGRSPDEAEQWQAALPGPPAAWRVREGREVVHHLFRVAAGLESLATGEVEVRSQVRAAGSTVASRHPRPVLRELFDGAAEAAGGADPSGSAPRSIAAIAAEYLLEITRRPRPRVVVVGTGTVGRQLLEALAPSAEITVVYHRSAPPHDLLEPLGVRAVGFDRLAEAISDADAVVTAAKFGPRLLGAEALPTDHPVVLVDLGVPRNIDPAVRGRPNVRLVDLAELHARSRTIGSGGAPDARVEEQAGRFSDRFERFLVEPWIDSLRRDAEELRRAELETARRHLGPLEPEQVAAIDRLTRRLVARLLLAPTERIRELPPGPEGEARRRFAVELLRPRPPAP